MRRFIQFTLIVYGVGLVLVAGWHWGRVTNEEIAMWLFFDSNRDGNWEIYRMRPDGTRQQNLTQDPGYDELPVLSQDGQWLFFQSNRDGNWEIYRMRPDGTRQQNLTQDPGD